MNVLIVGGAGEVGRYLVKLFSDQGHHVMVFDRATKPLEINDQPPVAYLKGDITDPALVKEAVYGKEVIIHLAWSFSDDPKTIFNEDIKGHIHLLEASLSSGIKHFIYTSTATVYGRSVIHPVAETHPCLINDARKPLYALGKFTAEGLCNVYSRERGLPVTIFRFWWAFGESIGGRHLRDLVKKALKNEPLEMVQGAGGAFVTMADLGRAMIAAIRKPTPLGQTYNLGSLFLAWEDIGKMIIQLAQSYSPIQLIPSAEWKGPAFLNEVWDLSWEKSERNLDFIAGDTAEGMRSQFIKALKKCVDQVREEK